MASTARVARASTQHSRLRRRAQLLTEEVGRLGALSPQDPKPSAPDLHLVSRAGSAPFNVEGFLDKAVDFTRGWERISALVALITTNLSGNKSLGALLEIMAKDRALPTGNSAPTQGAQTLGSFNIAELLGMAETLLKTGQLPVGLQVPMAPATHQVPDPQSVEGDVIEATVAEGVSGPAEPEGSAASEELEPADSDSPAEVDGLRP